MPIMRGKCDPSTGKRTRLCLMRLRVRRWRWVQFSGRIKQMVGFEGYVPEVKTLLLWCLISLRELIFHFSGSDMWGVSGVRLLQCLRVDGIPQTDFGGFRKESGCAKLSEGSLAFDTVRWSYTLMEMDRWRLTREKMLTLQAGRMRGSFGTKMIYLN